MMKCRLFIRPVLIDVLFLGSFPDLFQKVERNKNKNKREKNRQKKSMKMLIVFWNFFSSVSQSFPDFFE